MLQVKVARVKVMLMKKFQLTIVSLILSIVCFCQEYKESGLVQTITHKIIVPEGGSLNEALSLSQEWVENVLRKNENFRDIQLLLSDTSKDTVDLMVVYNYKTEFNRDTNEINQELIKAYWKEDGSFEKFLEKLHSYINPKLNQISRYRELILVDSQ